MANMPISQAREQLPAVIELCQSEAVVLEKYGKPQAVVISYERYEELMNAFEDLQDLEYLEQIPPDLSNSIPWEDFKRDLGI